MIIEIVIAPRPIETTSKDKYRVSTSSNGTAYPGTHEMSSAGPPLGPRGRASDRPRRRPPSGSCAPAVRSAAVHPLPLRHVLTETKTALCLTTNRRRPGRRAHSTHEAQSRCRALHSDPSTRWHLGREKTCYRYGVMRPRSARPCWAHRERTRPSTPPPIDMDGAVDIRSWTGRCRGTMPTPALSSDLAPSAAPVVTDPDGAPVMPKLILNACCPSGQARSARIPPSAVCAFPFVSSNAFSFVMIPSVPMSITSLLSAIRAVFLNK